MSELCRRPKILFIIFNYTHGRGGHYFSLQSTLKGLKPIIDLALVIVGKKSEVLSELSEEVDITYLPIDNYYRTAKALSSIISNSKIDAVHAFDRESLLVSRICSMHFKGMPFLYTKCGGANSKYYHPYVDNLILYSLENKKYFESKLRFKNSIINVIPNRIHSVPQDYQLISEIRSVIFKNKTESSHTRIMLRICRFSKLHKSSILQSISFFHDLRDAGLDIVLVLVGTVQDQNVFDELIDYSNVNLFVFTQANITKHASKIIDVADIVAGTGRSFMEGAVYGKIMLVPCDISGSLVLVDEKNIDFAFNYNFSSRTPIKNVENSVFQSKVLIENEEKLQTYKELLKNYSKNNFLVNSVQHRYLDLYRSPITKKIGMIQVVDIALHYLSAIAIRFRRFRIIKF